MKTDESREKNAENHAWYVLLIVLFLLPWIILFLLPGEIYAAAAAWIWIFLIINFLLIWFLLRSRAAAAAAAEMKEEGALRMLSEAEMPDVIREVMDVRLATEEVGVKIFRGRLLEPAQSVYEKLKIMFSDTAVPLIQEDPKLGAAILLMPNEVEKAQLEKPVRPWVHWSLFGLTVLTTTWAGAIYQGVNLLNEPGRFMVGLPYSLGLMAILGCHELGHYFTARHHGLRVTPPYFVPVPFLLGTFGAFIRMRSPPENRRALFDTAVAGPLAGLVIAIPALMIGIRQSAIVPAVEAVGAQLPFGAAIQSSILFSMIAKFSLGAAFTQGDLILLSPLAFAGWLGLLVTALNLLPIGQLDGGHIARGMFGTRIGEGISRAAMLTLFLLALFVWPALLFWAIIVFFIARTGAPPLNDITPINRERRWIGYLSFLILLSILVPVPQAFRSATEQAAAFIFNFPI